MLFYYNIFLILDIRKSKISNEYLYIHISEYIYNLQNNTNDIDGAIIMIISYQTQMINLKHIPSYIVIIAILT